MLCANSSKWLAVVHFVWSVFQDVLVGSELHDWGPVRGLPVVSFSGATKLVRKSERSWSMVLEWKGFSTAVGTTVGINVKYRFTIGTTLASSWVMHRAIAGIVEPDAFKIGRWKWGPPRDYMICTAAKITTGPVECRQSLDGSASLQTVGCIAGFSIDCHYWRWCGTFTATALHLWVCRPRWWNGVINVEYVLSPRAMLLTYLSILVGLSLDFQAWIIL